MTDSGTAPEGLATVTAIMQAVKGLDPTFVDPEVTTIEPAKAIKELGPELRRAVEAFEAAKEMKKYADSQKDLWEEIIRDALAGAEIGTIDGKPVIKVNHSHTSYVKAAVVREGWPECYAAAHTEVPYTFLTVVK